MRVSAKDGVRAQCAKKTRVSEDTHRRVVDHAGEAGGDGMPPPLKAGCRRVKHELGLLRSISGIAIPIFFSHRLGVGNTRLLVSNLLPTLLFPIPELAETHVENVLDARVRDVVHGLARLDGGVYRMTAEFANDGQRVPFPV